MLQINIGEKFLFKNEGVKNVFPDPGRLISTLLPNIFILTGVLLLIFLLFGGIMMITNAGNAQKQEEGRNIIGASLAGLILVFGSFWLLQIIEVITGIDIIKPQF